MAQSPERKVAFCQPADSNPRPFAQLPPSPFFSADPGVRPTVGVRVFCLSMWETIRHQRQTGFFSLCSRIEQLNDIPAGGARLFRRGAAPAQKRPRNLPLPPQEPQPRKVPPITTSLCPIIFPPIFSQAVDAKNPNLEKCHPPPGDPHPPSCRFFGFELDSSVQRSPFRAKVTIVYSFRILYEKIIELKPFWQQSLLHSMFVTSNIKEFVL